MCAEVKWPAVVRTGGGDGRLSSSAATLGQAWSAITVAAVPSSNPLLTPPSLPVLCLLSGRTGSDPRREDLLCGPPGIRCSGERGRALAVSMLGGGKNQVPRERALAVRGAARSLVSLGAPRAGELSLPLASLFGRC